MGREWGKEEGEGVIIVGKKKWRNLSAGGGESSRIVRADGLCRHGKEIAAPH
jgi:hypothetical protein